MLDSVEIHGCVAACENLISGKSEVLRPGDIVQAASGKYIEVNNTDAEGRLTLADAIWYARKHIDADVIVDLATLTGAMKVANGPLFSGYFANSDLLANLINQSGLNSGDPVWRYPLCNEYRKNMDSQIADYQNSATGM